jgi:hypothetical protein
MNNGTNRQIRVKFSDNGLNVEVLNFNKENINVVLEPFGNSGKKHFSAWKFVDTLESFDKEFAENKDLAAELKKRILRGGGGQTIGILFTPKPEKTSLPEQNNIK